MSELSQLEKEFIQNAALYLESPSLAMKFAKVLGRPVEFGLERLPGAVHETIHSATKKIAGGCTKSCDQHVAQKATYPAI